MIISEVFIFYLIVTAGLAMVGMLLYLTADRAKERQWTARATLLAWLWPIFLVIFFVVLLFNIIKSIPRFLKDALGVPDGTDTNN
jgi:hypothetical protein